MSDNVPSSTYADGPTEKYDFEFRALVMQLFMDHLGIEEIEKYFFLGNLPKRLKDEPKKLRSEILTYVNDEGNLDEWMEKPRILRKILETIGRKDLSLEVQNLVDSKRSRGYSSAEENPSPVETNSQRNAECPVQETTQDSSVTEREGGERERCLQDPGVNQVLRRQPAAVDLEDDYELPRTSSNASDRSSGYYSVRGSDARLSRFSIPEKSEMNNDSLECNGQTTIAEEDEGVTVDMKCSADVSIQSDESAKTYVFPSLSDCTRLLCTECPQMSPQSDKESQETRSRSRCYQFGHDSKKDQDDSFSLSLSPDAVVAASTSLSPLTSDSSSSSSSLDSDDAIESTSKGCELQRSVECVHIGTTKATLKKKSYPVDSQVNIYGRMTVKIKNVLKSIKKKKNNQAPMISDEFPSPQARYGGPPYEMRFHPANFSNTHTSLYIDVARSYLRKQDSIVEIPAMSIEVTLSYDEQSAKSCSRDIKLVTVHREVKKKMVDTQSKDLTMDSVVANFPQLISHDDLQKLSQSDSRSLTISVNMYVC